MFKIFDIAASGMSAQQVRLNTVASNLANAGDVSGNPEDVYRARQPVFSSFAAALSDASSVGVRVQGIVESSAAPTEQFSPGHPQANADGYVFSSNVNTVEEMVNMMSASRSYQNNIEVLNTSKELMMRTLSIGQ